jgi:hypothetical protein
MSVLWAFYTEFFVSRDMMVLYSTTQKLGSVILFSVVPYDISSSVGLCK